MRLICVVIFAGTVVSTGASASSFETLGAPKAGASPSFVYLGGSEPKLAEAATTGGSGAQSPALATALQYPAPLGKDLTAAKPAADDDEPRIALHYPAPIPPGLKAPNGSAPIVRLSRSVIAMGEPEVEYFKVAAVPKRPAAPRFALAPLVIRGGISGDAFVSSGNAPSVPVAPSEKKAKTEQASARKDMSQEEAKRALEDAAPKAEEPPPPPKGMSPLSGMK
jgi:hypothetical protein